MALTQPGSAANPYWNKLADHVEASPWTAAPVVAHFGWPGEDAPDYRDVTRRYAYTISDPETVRFVREHCGDRVLDPMAGTGYWAWLLRQDGVDVAAADLYPPDTTDNPFHSGAAAFTGVDRAEAAVVGLMRGKDRTLLLAWPPRFGVGARVLTAYLGPRVVFMGETHGDNCGDPAMFAALDTGWNLVAEHRPVRFTGVYDYVRVYERRPCGSSPSRTQSRAGLPETGSWFPTTCEHETVTTVTIDDRHDESTIEIRRCARCGYREPERR